MPTNPTRYNVGELLRELCNHNSPSRVSVNERKTSVDSSTKRVTVEYTDIVNYTFPYLKKTKELQKLKNITIAKVVKRLEAKTIKDKERHDKYINSREEESRKRYDSYFTDDFIT